MKVSNIGGACVDRDSTVMLVDQVVAKLKAAMLKGRYRMGETLPGAIALAKQFGTSEKTTRHALRRLAEDGWVKPVRGVGAIVLSRSPNDGCRGHVLVLYSSAYRSYYFQMERDAFRNALSRRGYRLSYVVMGPTRTSCGLFELRELLQRKWDLIVEGYYSSESRALIERSGLPFVSRSMKLNRFRASPRAMGEFRVNMGLALPEFYKMAAKKNVRHVWQFLIGGGGFDVAEPLQRQGCTVTTFNLPVVKRQPFNASARFVFSEIVRRHRSKSPLPDVILFGDDHFCTPGLLALASCGIRVPEDVKVVTYSNKGDEPVSPRELTRIELDVPDVVSKMSKQLIEVLQGHAIPPLTEFGSKWVSGETF